MGYLKKKFFVRQPPGFVKKGCEYKVYKLKKALYGLKQAPMIEDFKKSMMHEFEMTDLDLMSYFLSTEVIQGDDGVFICQKRIPAEVGTNLSREVDGAQVDPAYFKQLVESLRYLPCTRLDVAYGVGLISRYLEAPRQSHLQVAKRIMRCLKETYDHGLFYYSSNNCDVVGYSDSDWSGDHDDCKSTSGYIFNFVSTAFS
ncbi:uncharacterized protein LOC109847806 [Asparagus officinalis]|uniref:uncharacterized protein LOC109847806 n=1 Tax=Asparagus officinalis TaxID=4686 RepID=UPI00098E1217|nr:uncharacterized protein LOC109847806 [Asparagus officinalis]